MRLSRKEEAICVYERIIRLWATIEVTLNKEQINMISSWLKEEAARDIEDKASVALRMFDNILRLSDDDNPNT